MALTESFRGRHELKFLISYAEYLALEGRISTVLTPDQHAGENGYFIRSVYFDDMAERAYYDKLAGVADRRKYRIRAYNHNPDYIALECKEKHGRWTRKTAARIDPEVCSALLRGDSSGLEGRSEAVCREVYLAFRDRGLKCSVIVDYRREAYLFPASNVRITFDHSLHAGGLSGFCLFSENKETEPAIPVYRNNSVILEIKYDQYFPDIIRSLMPGFLGPQLSISKYCLCMDAFKAIHC